MNSSKITLDAELIHNWSQRYSGLPYFNVITASQRAAIQAAHLRHHREGDNAQELAVAITAQFPEVFDVR